MLQGVCWYINKLVTSTHLFKFQLCWTEELHFLLLSHELAESSKCRLSINKIFSNLIHSKYFVKNVCHFWIARSMSPNMFHQVLLEIVWVCPLKAFWYNIFNLWIGLDMLDIYESRHNPLLDVVAIHLNLLYLHMEHWVPCQLMLQRCYNIVEGSYWLRCWSLSSSIWDLGLQKWHALISCVFAWKRRNHLFLLLWDMAPLSNENVNVNRWYVELLNQLAYVWPFN